jgi:hypothetical protein
MICILPSVEATTWFSLSICEDGQSNVYHMKVLQYINSTSRFVAFVFPFLVSLCMFSKRYI